jgi:germination protein YpeB
LKISKKAITLFGIYIIAGFLTMGGFIIKANAATNSYKRQTTVDYSRAFSELTDCVENMSNAFKKACYSSSSGMLSSILSEVYSEATSAESALSILPSADIELEHTASFLSKTGDYVFYLSRYAASGGEITDEHRQNLTSLSKSAQMVSSTLSNLDSQLLSGSLSITELYKLEDTLSQSEDSMVNTGFADSIKEMETEFPELPSLIYDGPFSEHISSLTPKLTEGKTEISKENILYVASEFLGIDRSRLTLQSEREGEIPVYVITTSNSTTELTKSGGYVLYYGSTRPVNYSKITVDNALKYAESFLKSRSISGMKTTYYEIQNNTVLFNFAYSENDVIYYPDLIKVSVALDDGEIVGFESAGYIMNHTQRQLSSIEISSEDAQAKLTTGLTVLSHNITVIPTNGKNEILCHEFKCEDADGNHCLIYINAATGAEEKILILLENENGTLTI